MLSRRSFLTFFSAAAFVALPGLAQAFSPSQFIAAGRAHSVFVPWEVLETSTSQDVRGLEGKQVSLSGYLSRQKGGVFLTRQPWHCDYCYLGNSQARVKVEGNLPALSSRPVRLKGEFLSDKSRAAGFALKVASTF